MSAMSDSDNLVIYPMPSLVSTLLDRERAKGSPLTEAEVIEIRDSCPSVASRLTLFRKLMPSAVTRTLTRSGVGSSGRRRERV